MATRSSFLQLILPLNGEYTDTWDQPMNENSERIDLWAAGVDAELVDSRFGFSSLKAFLEVAHEVDGTLKPTAEVLESRSSVLYGDEDSGAVDYDLSKRLDLGDMEVLLAREGQPSLREGRGFGQYLQNQIMSGSKDVNGYPTWMGSTGAIVRIDGSIIPVYMMIGGKVCRVRSLEEVDLTGQSAGTKYIYALFEADGVIRIDGDSTTAPPASPTGLTGNDGTKDRKFTDAVQNFSTSDVEPNDILEILGTNVNAKEYTIKSIAPGGDNTSLIVNGIFPGGSLANLDYIIKDPFSPSFGFDAALAPVANKLYIGEVDFDGSSVTAVRALNFKDVFVSEWRAIDVGTSPTFEEIFNHNLLSTELDITVQASQANDGSLPIEVLPFGKLASTLGVSVNNTLNYTPAVFNPGTTDASYTPGSLTGGVSASLTGSVAQESSILMKFTKTQIFVKNPVANVFYTDYSGAAQTAGFIRIIARKRG